MTTGPTGAAVTQGDEQPADGRGVRGVVECRMWGTEVLPLGTHWVGCLVRRAP